MRKLSTDPPARKAASFQRGIPKPKCIPIPECEYVYRDIYGNEQFIKVRCRYRHARECDRLDETYGCHGRDKTFRYKWQGPEPSKPLRTRKSEQEKLPYADGFLYRLDEWWPDYRYGRITEVWWAEGEKDVDALSAPPGYLPATTHHQGAGNATLEQARWFAMGKRQGRGRRVVLVADLDDAGAYCAAWRHDLLIEAKFQGKIRIVRARAGNDAADHLAAGYRIDEFVPVDIDRLMEAARRYKSNLKQNTARYMGDDNAA